MPATPMTRRRFLTTTTAAGALAMPFVRGAYAAGKLTLAFWDHFVPGANDALKALVDEWGAKEKVEVQTDFITSQGDKLLLTIAAEAQARSGHDVITTAQWNPRTYATSLEPVSDIMQALIGQNGPVNETVEYLGKAEGQWIAVPATYGSQIQAPCSRIDLMKQHAGVDVQELYPAGQPPKAESWTLDSFLKAAEACHKAGFPFGLGLGTTHDSVNVTGAFFRSFGATLVDPNGAITIKTDAVRQAVEYCTRLARFLPADAPAWDDASNNKWFLSGKGALIMNAPSVWIVAQRDAPRIAEQCWTHGFPAGPQGRFLPYLPFFWGLWNFSKNKSAAKSLLVHLSQPAAAEKMVTSTRGYDLPPFTRMATFKAWAEAGPPSGTLYHYPNPHDHHVLSIGAAPSPPLIARQIYVQGLMTKMVVRHMRGEPMEKMLAWAETEVEGFRRT